MNKLDKTLDRYNKPFKVIDNEGLCYYFADSTKDAEEKLKEMRRKVIISINDLYKELNEHADFLSEINEYSIVKNEEAQKP